MNKQLKGSIYLLLATAIWGSTFIAQSIAANYVGAFTFQAGRGLLACIVLLPIIYLSDKKNKRSFAEGWLNPKLWKGGLCCGIALFLASNLQQLGIEDTDPGKSAFLTAMYIVIVPIIGIFRKEKPSLMIPISVVLAVVGLYFVSCAGVTGIAVGDLLLLGCALAFAVQITFVDIFSGQVDPLRLNWVQMLFCCVLSAAVMLFTETVSVSALLDCWGPLCYAGIGSMGIAYTFQILGQRDLKPSVATVIMSLESVFAVLCDWLILRNVLTVWERIGCGLIFAAVLLAQIPTGKQPAAVEENAKNAPKC